MRKASQERGFYYHPSRHSAAQPIVAGWAYQWIARLDFAHDGWVAPMDVVRVRAKENANEVAAGQVKGLLRRLPEWCEREEEAPLFVFDAGYDPVQLQQQGLEGYCAQLLVRLRTGRCFYAADPPPPKKTDGSDLDLLWRASELGASTSWSIPSASSSRLLWDGPPLGYAIRSRRLTAGVG